MVSIDFAPGTSAARRGAASVRMPGHDPFRSLAGQPAKDGFAVQEQSFSGTYLAGTLGQARTLAHAVEI